MVNGSKNECHLNLNSNFINIVYGHKPLASSRKRRTKVSKIKRSKVIVRDEINENLDSDNQKKIVKKIKIDEIIRNIN